MPSQRLKEFSIAALIAFMAMLYLLRMDADTIAGLFGIYYCDEGTYLLSARNFAIFGTSHFFEGDIFKPELLAPLADQFARLIISTDDTIGSVRTGICLLVLGGIGMITRLAWKHHGKPIDAITCALCIMLSPVLFFYARVGLSEGIQFFLLACVLTLLFQLLHCRRDSTALLLATAIGIFSSILLLAKISAIGMAAGCGIGFLACVYRNPLLEHKHRIVLVATLAALLTSCFYFSVFLQDNLQEWWYTNIQIHVKNHITPDWFEILEISTLKFAYLCYFFVLMPIFALYLMSLLMATNMRTGFIFVLCLMTITVMGVEFFITGVDAMGSIRRNFFGLSMLTILSGFTVRQWLDAGSNRAFHSNPLKITGAVIIGLYLYGIIFMLQWTVRSNDWLYSILAATFLILMVITIFCTLKPQAGRPRKWLAALAIIASLIPMLFQSFFAPYTRQEINAEIERMVPEDAVILSSLAPWYFHGVKRKMVLTNCVNGVANLFYANDIDKVPLPNPKYYIDLSPIENNVCAPADTENYEFLTKFNLFNPENFGGLVGISKNWTLSIPIYVYRKKE